MRFASEASGSLNIHQVIIISKYPRMEPGFLYPSVPQCFRGQGRGIKGVYDDIGEDSAD